MERDTKILIIDEEPSFIRTAQKALEVSYEVATASSAREGLKKAREENPDVIILGYLEPRGTSFQLHNELREDLLTKNVPLLIVDVRPEEHSRKGWKRHEGVHMNANDYIARPVEGDELTKVVEGIIRRASGEPMGLKEASEYMEKALERINKIEELLVR
jgi:DNA-binding response OmpR family regulator